jgi:hypothetical protein
MKMSEQRQEFALLMGMTGHRQVSGVYVLPYRVPSPRLTVIRSTSPRDSPARVNAKRTARSPDLSSCDARREVVKDKYKAFMELEATARVMWMFQLAVPGLLQTEDYARTVLSGLSRAQTTAGNNDEIEEQVALRMGRQELLYREPATSMRVILDEGALRRPVPEAKVWADQLSRLLDAAELQVLPHAAGVHDLMNSHLTLLWQRVGDPVAYVEGNSFGESIDDPDKVLSFR